MRKKLSLWYRIWVNVFVMAMGAFFMYIITKHWRWNG